MSQAPLPTCPVKLLYQTLFLQSEVHGYLLPGALGFQAGLRSWLERCVLCRWWTGEWHPCSHSCGPSGLALRSVLCIRSLRLDEQIALEPSACQHLVRPASEIPCNQHVPCPPTWAVGNWSQVCPSGGVSGVRVPGSKNSLLVGPSGHCVEEGTCFSWALLVWLGVGSWVP